LIKLKRWGAEYYVYVRPESVTLLWQDRDNLVRVELWGKKDEILIEGPLAEVAAKLGLTLTD
jgi:hypothetical protein